MMSDCGQQGEGRRKILENGNLVAEIWRLAQELLGFEPDEEHSRLGDCVVVGKGWVLCLGKRPGTLDVTYTRAGSRTMLLGDVDGPAALVESYCRALAEPVE